MRGFQRTLALMTVWTLGIVLSGCHIFIAEEPPVTWVPLPTMGAEPTDTESTDTELAPSATPSSTSTLTSTAIDTVAPTSALAPTAIDTLAPTSALTPTSTRTATPTRTVTPTRGATVAPPAEDVSSRAAWTRDRAWDHLVATSPGRGLPLDPAWAESGPDALIDAAHYQYRTGDWVVDVAVPVVVPRDAVHDVSIAGPDRFEWSGQIKSDGTIRAELVETPTRPSVDLVEGWRGTLHSLPSEAPFDDFFRLLGGDEEEFGLQAPDPAIEVRIVRLRDSGRIVHIWGELRRDVADHEDVQIAVNRVEVQAPRATPVPESELVDGWAGLVWSLPAGSAHDDYFDEGRPDGQYGISSLMPRLSEEIASYRDTGLAIRVWGILDYSVHDHGGTRILVSRIQLVGP